jgi:hypothetical protein
MRLLLLVKVSRPASVSLLNALIVLQRGSLSQLPEYERKGHD